MANPRPRAVRLKFGLLSLCLAGAGYAVASFHPLSRFADPSPGELPEVRASYHCFYDQIYGESGGMDILFFGASKTRFGVNAELVGASYRAVTGEDLAVFAFHTAMPNPGLMYFFFRDYLAHNPAPRQAFFELTAVNAHSSAVKYVHPYFANLAPPYLYLDVLRSREVVTHGLFAASDVLRLLIRHLDLGLARLLRPNVHAVVPDADHCATPAPAPALDQPGATSFEQWLAAEVGGLRLSLDTVEAGDKAALLDTYADDPLVTAFINGWDEPRRARFEQHFWGAREGMERMRERSLDYYRRIVALAEAHDVDIAFYYLPNVYAPEPGEDAVRRVSRSLGAPVHVLPYPVAEVSYHFYRDPAHITPALHPAFSVWFASLIEQAADG